MDTSLRFNEYQRQIENVIPIPFDVPKQLINELSLKEKNYRQDWLLLHLRKESRNKCLHPSYKSEFIKNIEEFFASHMMKISQSYEEFNQKRSNLFIKIFKRFI